MVDGSINDHILDPLYTRKNAKKSTYITKNMVCKGLSGLLTTYTERKDYYCSYDLGIKN